jgi:hypothetical protein
MRTGGLASMLRSARVSNSCMAGCRMRNRADSSGSNVRMSFTPVTGAAAIEKKSKSRGREEKRRAE